MFKPLSLLLLRASTGLLIFVWGTVKLIAPDRAAAVSDRYYFGLISADAASLAVGGFQVLLGALVVLGLFRRIVYPLQAAVLGLGALFIWSHLIDPLSLVFADRNILFFPSWTLFFATLVLLAFRDEDRFVLDRR